MAYTVVERDRNSWTRTAQGADIHDISFDCGHHHRNLASAIRCLHTLRGHVLAHIESASADQKYDGKAIPTDSDEYRAAEQEAID